MKLTEIEISGFRGVRNHVRIAVPSGFMILVGRNGSGKSTICDAIEFALSGSIRESLHKEKGESYSDYIWWRGQGQAESSFVRLTFLDSDGTPFRIERTDSGSTSESEKNIARLFQAESAPDSPVASMCRTSLIRDEEITSLSIDLPEAERYRFVRDALGNLTASGVERRVESVREILQKRAKEYRRDYDKLRDTVSDLTSRLSDTQATIAGAAGSAFSPTELTKLFGVSSDMPTDQLQTGRQALAENRILLDSLHKVLSTVQQLHLDRKEVDSEEFKKELKELEGQLEASKEKLDRVSHELVQASQDVAMLRQSEPDQARLTELLEAGEALGVTPDEKCPLCGSKITKDNFHLHISETRKVIEEQNANIILQVKNQRELAQQQDELKHSVESMTQQCDALLSKKSVIEQQLKDATEQARAHGCSATNTFVTVDELRTTIEQLRMRSGELEKAVAWLESSSLTELVESLKEELKEAQKTSEEASSRLSRAENAVTKSDNARKGVKSVLGEIVDEQLAELSPLIEELYKRLRPHIEWTQVRYRLRGTVRRMLSFEVGEGLNPSFVFSSGQRRAAGLAFLLSVHLSRPWCNWNSLILDDPVQHVDDFRALNLTEVLSAIRKNGRQIICSVEDEALARLLCRRLRSSPEDSGSLVRMTYDRESGVNAETTMLLDTLKRDVLVPA